MNDPEVDSQARNLALKILASYVASIAALILAVLLLLIAAREFGVDKDLIRIVNMGTPVVAIGLSLLIHFLTNHKLRRSVTVSAVILLFSMITAMVAYAF